MNQSELRELLSAEGLRLLDSLPIWHSSDEIVRTVAERAAEVDRTLAEMLEPDAPGAAAAVDEAQQEKEQPVG